MKLRIGPCTLTQAEEFVQDWHRTHDASQGGLWAVSLWRRCQDCEAEIGRNIGTELVGVAIAGRPVSKELQRRGYCEVIRVCVIEGVEGGCSMLYRRVRRIAQLMGYERFISYTLPGESGASLRAAGFHEAGMTRGGSWHRGKRPRVDKHPTQAKLRWEA